MRDRTRDWNRARSRSLQSLYYCGREKKGTVRSQSPGQTVLPTQAKITTSMELDIVWATHLAWASSSNFRPTRSKFSTVWPPQATQANSNQVALLMLRDYAVVFRQLNGFLQVGSTWRYSLATRQCTFWFVTWLELTWVGSTVWPGLNGSEVSAVGISLTWSMNNLAWSTQPRLLTCAATSSTLHLLIFRRSLEEKLSSASAACMAWRLLARPRGHGNENGDTCCTPFSASTQKQKKQLNQSGVRAPNLWLWAMLVQGSGSLSLFLRSPARQQNRVSVSWRLGKTC